MCFSLWLTINIDIGYRWYHLLGKISRPTAKIRIILKYK